MSIKTSYLFQLTEEKNNCLVFKLHEANIYARIYVLETDIVRVFMTSGEQPKIDKTWLVAPGLEDIPFTGRNRHDTSLFSLPAYKTEQDASRFYIETTKMKVAIRLDGFQITWYARDEQSSELVQFAKDRSTQAYNFDGSLGEGVYHYLERDRREQYYGLGEKSGEMNRHGRRYRMHSLDPMGYDAETTDPLYKHIPYYLTYQPETKLSFGIFYDNMSQSVFDMGNEMDNYHGLYRYFQAIDGDLDYYIVLGPEMKQVVERISWLTGQTIFAPKWSLGYSGSTMSYTDAPDAQVQLHKFLALCEEHDIICDSFQLSSGYTSIEDKRYVFHWNKEKFPNPEQLFKKFHDQGVRLCANIKPCLLTDHPKYKELADANMFIQNPAGTEEERAQFWDETGAYLDFTNEKTIKWWKEQVTEQLLNRHIDSTWNDNNEFEIWTRDAKCHGFGTIVDFEKLRAIQPLLMMKASYEAQKEYAPNIRPYLISRSGCPGMQRYVQTWSGDNYTEWKALKYNIKMGLGLSLSGIYNIGHDVGGFAGPAPEPELFVRWVQNGIFHPRFTIHSWNSDQTVNVPWMYPEVAEDIKNLIKFRYQLTPYLYNALYEAHAYYRPVIRPVFYEFSGDERTFEPSDDFMLGDAMLVASVVEKGATTRQVYLPAFVDGWYDYHEENWYEGGQTITVPAPFDKPPLLIKAGSMIPTNDDQVTFAVRKESRGIKLFPHAMEGQSEYTLFEDDGVSIIGDTTFTKIHLKMTTTATQIDVHVTKTGAYQLPYEQIHFYAPRNETRKLLINGKELESQENCFSFAVSECEADA
ncbi:glycoside hydrolase family 31 protein [Paenilisteria rocourtiae]|uniref:Alpha-glucosidase n=1 Tax=Listeria rocourtiae TaxID=647910 RepID=A0A4R6ZSI9_9LIST|nr:glycoside hydrolase family 31 protein [Listeria rocourtiae]TDR55565.1 alpha-glucosidase [Listeria rocourtiae]